MGGGPTAAPEDPALGANAATLDAAQILALLGALSDWYRIPFDPRLAASRVPAAVDVLQFDAVLDAFGFRSRRVTGPAGDPGGAGVLPRVVFRSGPSDVEVPGDDPPEHRIEALLVLRADATRVLALRAGAPAPEVIAVDTLAVGMLPWAVHVERARPPSDTDTLAGFDPAPTRFGLKWFLPALLRHRPVWRDVLIASLLIQIVGLATPLLTQVIVDKVVVHEATSTLTVVGLALAVFMTFSVALTWSRQLLVLHTGNRIDAVLGSEVFARLLRLPMRWFESRPVGTIVTRLHGIETIREFLTGALVTLVLDIPFVVIFLALMFWYSWQLSLAVVAALAVIVVMSVAVTPALRRRADQQYLLGARTQAFVTEYVGGIATAKLLQAEPRLEHEYRGRLSDYLGGVYRTRRLAISYGAWSGATEQAMSLSLLVLGAWQVMHEAGFTIGMLVAFQMLASRLTQPVMRLTGLWLEAQQTAVAVERLRDLMECPEEPHTAAPRRFETEAAELRLERVSFRYDESLPWVLEDVTLTVRRGELVVLTGASGCGKSTITRLLCGFAQVQGGRILVGGTDIRHLAADELRRTIGVVLQETRLFSGTVLENLQLASPEATTKDIVQACRAADIHQSLEALPHGYQTRIGEGGVGLSGGQRQRIAIARALLKRPDILVFDEATSGLDAQAATRIVRTLNALKPQLAIVFIAHQWPRELAADRVHRFDAERHRAASGWAP